MAGTRDPLTGAMQWNPMLVGQKRYGANGSGQATSGTLPKAGYQERERQNRLRALLQERLAAMNGKV